MYTLSPYGPPLVFRSLRNLDGPEEASVPGKNPSFVLQVGMAEAVQQAVNPKLAPANPTKVLTLSFRLGPT